MSTFPEEDAIIVFFFFSEGISDRFYAALYRKLLDVEHSSAQERQLFILLVKALKNDSVDQRVIAFIKRLLQVS